MLADSFEDACDRLSGVVDAVQFERVRWARHEGPMLDHLVQLAQATLADRPDMELASEGSTGAIRRFVLKVHGSRIVAITVALDGEDVAVWGEAIERSAYKIVDGQRHTVAFSQLSETGMKALIEAVIAEVH